MRVFVDANVIFDVVLKREPFFQDSNTFLLLCAKRQASLAPHTVTNAFYTLQKELSEEEGKSMLLEILSFMDVVTIGKPQIIKALKNNAIGDFEDALQLECAREFGADCIVTRDPKYFVGSGIKTMSPRDFLEKHGRSFGAKGAKQ